MEHLALTIFSICVQAAIGLTIFVAIGRLANKEGIFKNSLIIATVLGIIGMAASLLHLGRPFVAFHALYKFGSSWLSREIWLTAIVVGLLVLAVILTLKKPTAKSTIDALIYVAALVGLADVAAMAAIYNTSSVPIWQTSQTFIEFYAAAISMGAVLFLLLGIKEVAQIRKAVTLIITAVVIIQVATFVPSLISFSVSTNAAVQSSMALLSSMTMVTVLKWVFILAGAIWALWMAKDEISPSMSNAVLGSAVLLVAGQAIGRYLFYAIMVMNRVGLS